MTKKDKIDINNLDNEKLKEYVSNTFTKRFNELVKEKREKENIKTNKELAVSMGIKEQSFINYETGRLPDTLQLIKIAKYFDVSLEYLIGDSDNRNYLNYSLGKEYGISDEAKNNLEKYVKNDEDGLIYIINLLLGDNYLQFIRLLEEYITFPSKDNEYLDNFVKELNENALSEKYNKKYNEDSYIYLYRICKKLEEISTGAKKSKKVAELYMNKSNDIIEDLRNWNGD